MQIRFSRSFLPKKLKLYVPCLHSTSALHYYHSCQPNWVKRNGECRIVLHIGLQILRFFAGNHTNNAYEKLEFSRTLVSSIDYNWLGCFLPPFIFNASGWLYSASFGTDEIFCFVEFHLGAPLKIWLYLAIWPKNDAKEKESVRICLRWVVFFFSRLKKRTYHLIW